MAARRPVPLASGAMIYCVVPPELEADLFEELSAYYADEPHVEVIRDRRRRSPESDPTSGRPPRPRFRRRARVPGEFPPLAGE